MTQKRYYVGSTGPFVFDDEGFIEEAGDLFVGMHRVGFATDSDILADGFGFIDLDRSHFLKIRWNENGSADRVFNILVGGGDRSLTMNEDLIIGDGNSGTLTYSAASKTLTVEGNAVVSQDYSSDASPTFASLILANATVADDARSLSSICTLVTNAKSDGIAAYFEGHIDGTTDGPTYGGGAWLNVDSGSVTQDIRAWDIGIYESGANCTGGNAYGLAIHMEFDDTNPPAAIYPFRINCNDTANHATPDALIFAPNKSAIALIDAAPGTADAYLKIKLQSGEIYKMMLVKE